MRISNTLIHYLQTSNDKIIIPDKRGNPQAVVLSFAEYQKFNRNQVSQKSGFKNQAHSLTNEEFLDKINADIQILKQRLEEQKIMEDFLVEENSAFEEEQENKEGYDPEEDRYYLEEI